MINYNGSLFQDSDPVLHHSNRSFRYGDGIFETIRVVNGNLHLFPLHFDRLLRAMKALKMIIPPYFNIHYMRNEVLKVIDKMPSARIRLAVWRESGGGYIATNNNVDYLIEAIPLIDKMFIINELGMTIGLYTDYRLRQTPVSAFKTANALPYILAGIYARENSFDDVLMLNTEGVIAEGISSNIFIFKDEKLITPPLNTGCVEGVMRSHIIELAQKSGVEVLQNNISLDDLRSADEVFFTNAIQGIRWVESFEYHVFSNDFTLKLHENLIKNL